MSSSDLDEPLLSIDVPLDVCGQGNEFHTLNDSPFDWERSNVIERTEDAIHIFCDLMVVKHGSRGEEAALDPGDLATVIVLRCIFDPQKKARRVSRAEIEVELLPIEDDGEPPVVGAIAPFRSWSLNPTKDEKTTTTGGELSLSTPSGIPALTISGKVNFLSTRIKDLSSATIVTGEMKMATGRNRGPKRRAAWTIRENATRRSGVPDSITVAIRVDRNDNKPFKATVALKTEADMATSFGRFFRKIPIDDPVLFNPDLDESLRHHTKEGRTYGVMGLDKIDLNSFCEARISAPAFWADGTPENS